ncbi:MAG: SDR family NAD(P)-dependent oxidoreductase [Armatimonadota bacterium]
MTSCVLVTGSAHGIGTAIVRAFLMAGATVLLVDVNEQELQKTVSALSLEFGDRVSSVTADLSNQDGVKAVLAAAKGLKFPISCIVNNAADQTPGTTESTTIDMFQRTMYINVTAPFLLVQGLRDDLIATSGCVINIGSLVGNQPIPGRVAYNTSKAAIAGLTRSLAVDLGPFGIRVNAIAPGHIMTDGEEKWKSTYDEFQQQVFPTSYAIGRVGQADEVAHVAVFLASPSAKFITGVTLPLDGGMSILCPETASFSAAAVALSYADTRVTNA